MPKSKKIVIVAVVSAVILSAIGFGWLYNKRKNTAAEPVYTVTTSSISQTVPLSEQTFTMEDLLANISEFVDTPKNGIAWPVFGRTGQKPYSFTGDDGMEWSGVRPEFQDDLKKLNGTEILIQGYMFPLDPEEKQSLFLLGPFPVSCPFHYHVTPNLIIEVEARSPIRFSYEPVNIKGKLELVPKDDENNVFYRLKEARLVSGK